MLEEIQVGGDNPIYIFKKMQNNIMLQTQHRTKSHLKDR